MRISLFCWLFLGTVLRLQAQPVLTAADHALPLQTDIRMHQASFIFPGIFPGQPSTSNNIWDFSGLTDSGTARTIRYLPCAQAPGASCGRYTGSNIVQDDSSGYYSYYITDNNRISLKGQESAGRNLLFGDPEDQLRFPFTVGSLYMDTVNGAYYAGNILHHVFGFARVEGAGSGTLKLPGSTYANVLLVIRVVNLVDTEVNGNGRPTSLGRNIWAWYAPGHAFPLLVEESARDILFSSDPPVLSAYYWDSTSPSRVPQPAQALDEVAVYPNPAREALQLQYRLQAAASVSATLSDMSGREVYCQLPVSRPAGLQHDVLPVAGLPAGVYLLRLTTGRQSVTRKISLY